MDCQTSSLGGLTTTGTTGYRVKTGVILGASSVASMATPGTVVQVHVYSVASLATSMLTARSALLRIDIMEDLNQGGVSGKEVVLQFDKGG